MTAPPRSQVGPGDDAFPFIRLPGEIRNRIYELALTAPTSQLIYCGEPLASNSGLYSAPSAIPNAGRGVFYLVHSLDRFFEDLDTSREFNQLKLVSRQLYKETAGLEVKLNIVLWVGCPPRPIEDRMGFPSTLPPSWETKLQTLVLRPSAMQAHLRHASDEVSIGSDFRREGNCEQFVCDLMDFCCKYPHVQVDWVMEDFALLNGFHPHFPPLADTIISLL